MKKSSGLCACLWPSDLVRIAVNIVYIDEGEVVYPQEALVDLSSFESHIDAWNMARG